MSARQNRSNQEPPRRRKSAARGGGGAHVSRSLRRSGLRGQEGAGYSDESDPLSEEEYSGRDRHPHRARYDDDEGIRANADVHNLDKYRSRLRKSRHGEDFAIYDDSSDFEEEEDLVEGYEARDSEYEGYDDEMGEADSDEPEIGSWDRRSIEEDERDY